ncbi:DPYL5 protein, partial [Columbina picui]|nr:DPYL5 protein [Columbina picui]
METLVREKGVNSFQMFMTYKDLYMLRDSELYQVFRACRDFGAIARTRTQVWAHGHTRGHGVMPRHGHTLTAALLPRAELTRTPCTLARAPLPHCPQPHACSSAPAGKVVYAETTTAHATLTGLHYYHQDWFHAAAYVTVPPLRLDTNTSAYLMSLLAK